MSLASAALLKKQSPLQQLLEDINFQRTKELRQLLKDDSGFVVLQGTTYWTDLFVRHFLFQTEPVHSIDSDDLLFFVRKKHVKSSSRHMPKYETEVDVFRKDSRKLPIGDPDVDWEETVYLNMVIHQFDYTLTLAICTRTSPKELQVLRRHSQRVYASPSRRKMDTKGEGEEITYPHICFMVDNFDEVFSDILVRDGEMVCVELVANDKDGAVQGVIFLGSIRYDALKKVYDARQSSLSSKVAQRMSFGLFSSGAGVQTRCEFVRMKGPQGKGHAEMAVTKPKGSGVETPTSEPGFCATDMWDDWDDENDDYCNYRHQRRLSDPSANLNNFSRHAWRTKSAQDAAGGAGAKARSENEGLDTLANEVSEIEAGDLRDDLRPAFSASETKLHINPKCEAHNTSIEPTTPPSTVTPAIPPPIESSSTVIEATAIVLTSPTTKTSTTGCGNCFGGKNKKCKRWITSTHADKNTPQMSEVYCPTCEDAANETPACLNKMPNKKVPLQKPKSILSVDSELVIGKRGSSVRLGAGKTVTRSLSLNSSERKPKKAPEPISTNKKLKPKLKETPTATNKEKSTTKTNLLEKVSPKRLRSKFTDKRKANQTSNQQRNNKANNNILVVEEKITVTALVEDDSKSQVEYEIADDACENLNCDESCASSKSVPKMAMLNERDPLLPISVRGREELPAVEESTPPPPTTPTPHTPRITEQEYQQGVALQFEKCARVPVKLESHPLQRTEELEDERRTSGVESIDNNLQAEAIKLENIVEDEKSSEEHETTPMLAQQNDYNGNCEASVKVEEEVLAKQQQQNGVEDDIVVGDEQTAQPRKKRSAAQQAFYDKALNLVPKRRTPDGTNIYYWCDLPRKALKELDDGAYNPLWASRGFTQSFHFWKENRRQQSTPLNAFLTYVTLPWWSIAKDLLDHRETPILTF